MNFDFRLYHIDLNRGATSGGPIHIDRAIGIRLLFYIFYSIKSIGGVFRGCIDGVARGRKGETTVIIKIPVGRRGRAGGGSSLLNCGTRVRILCSSYV